MGEKPQLAVPHPPDFCTQRKLVAMTMAVMHTMAAAVHIITVAVTVPAISIMATDMTAPVHHQIFGEAAHLAELHPCFRGNYSGLRLATRAECKSCNGHHDGKNDFLHLYLFSIV